MKTKHNINLIAIILGAFVFSGCSTERQLRILEYNTLSEKINTIEETIKQLEDKKIREHSDIQIFIGIDSINSALSAYDNKEYVIDEKNRIRIKYQSIRTNFSDFSPHIIIDAYAEEPHGIQVLMEVSAALSPHINESNLRLEPYIIDVSPKIKWHPFQFKTWMFVNKILKLEVQKYVESLPTIEIPLRSELESNLNKKENINLIIGDSLISGNTNTEGLNIKEKISFLNVYFSDEGIIIFGKMIKNE